MNHNRFTTASGSAPVEQAVYTVKQAAKLLGLSLGATYALVRGGGIPAKQLGGRWVIPRELFHNWLNTPTTPAGEHDYHLATADGGRR